MTEGGVYLTASGVESAIKTAAKSAAHRDPSLDVNTRIQLEYFNRFLARVFSDGDGSEWVLKGGMGILARVPSTRATRDVDLCMQGFPLAQAREDLIRLAQVDLGDHFKFIYVDHSTSIVTDMQPYIEGCRVNFKILLGVKVKGQLGVDLAVCPGPIGEVTVAEPANALVLSKLVSRRYRLYPVVAQIADKVCATMSDYNEHPSSRQKDLVDLVVLATTQNVTGAALKDAIVAEARRRQMAPITRFTVPSGWGGKYIKLSKSVPHCSAYPTVELACALIRQFIEPALSGRFDCKNWNYERRVWE